MFDTYAQKPVVCEVPQGSTWLYIIIIYMKLLRLLSLTILVNVIKSFARKKGITLNWFPALN